MKLKEIGKTVNKARKSMIGGAAGAARTIKEYKKRESNLDEQKKILKKNIKSEKDMVKNKKTYTNPYTGQKFGPDHYKKAVKYDQRELAKVNTKIALRDATKKAINSSIPAKAAKAVKVTKAGLSAYLKKTKK